VTLRRPVDLETLAWGGDGLLPVVVQEVASGAVLMLAWADREAVERTVERREAWFWSRSRRTLWRKGETSGNKLEVVEVALDCDGDALLYRVDAAGPACHTGARSCFEEVPAMAGRAPAAGEAPERLDEGRCGGQGAHSEAGATSEGDPGGTARGGGDGEAGTSSTSGASAGAARGVVRPITAAGSAGPRLEVGWLWDVLTERAAADPAASYTARLLAAGVDRIARKVGEEATEVVIAALRTAPPARVVATPEDPPLAGAGAAAPPAPVPLVAPGGAASSTPFTADASSAPRTSSLADAASADSLAPSRAADAVAAAPPAPVVASPLAAEAADLLYHLLVLLLAAGVPPEEVAAELRRRHARPSTPPSPKPEGTHRGDLADRDAAPPPEDLP
jgi:phosphoribosyl-AMP cyclohydrolase / phosphoribosyl-ATP pyrophosphohydrolase